MMSPDHLCTYRRPKHAFQNFAASNILLAILTQLVSSSALKIPPLVVTTSADFIAALSNKTQDIIVGNHLDLTELWTNGSAAKIHTRSIRVSASLAFASVVGDVQNWLAP
jgi:hypothetical protein